MKIIDYLIAALLVTCMFIGYSGHRFIALLLSTLVFILASWRFYDRKREKEIMRSHGSDELHPKHDDWADLKLDHGASTGDASG